MKRRAFALLVAIVLAHRPTGPLARLGAAPLAAQVRLAPGVTVASLEQAVAQDSNDPGLQYDLALGYWSEGRWDEAQRALEIALSVEPQNAPALMALAQLPFARRPQLQHEIDTETVPPEWQVALMQAGRREFLAILFDPLVDTRIVGAVTLDLTTSPRGADAIRRAAAVGVTAFRNGQYDQAYAWFERFGRLQGEGSDTARIPGFVYYMRGLSAAHLNDFGKALRDFRKLYAVDERDETAIYGTDPVLNMYILAWLEHRAGRYGRAIDLYREALTRDLSLYMAHVQMAQLYNDRGDGPAAIRERRLALEIEPENPALLLGLGMELVGNARFEEAAAVLERARVRLPRNYRVAYFQGVAATQLERTAEARAAFERFLALAPSRHRSEIAEVQKRLEDLR